MRISGALAAPTCINRHIPLWRGRPNWRPLPYVCAGARGGAQDAYPRIKQAYTGSLFRHLRVAAGGSFGICRSRAAERDCWCMQARMRIEVGAEMPELRVEDMVVRLAVDDARTAQEAGAKFARALAGALW